MDSTAVKQYLLKLQETIVQRLEQVDGKKFLRDAWERPNGTGGGISCIIEEGNVIERGGVAFSHVTGDKMPVSATQHRPELAGCSWEAMGVSLVMHPRVRESRGELFGRGRAVFRGICPADSR